MLRCGLGEEAAFETKRSWGRLCHQQYILHSSKHPFLLDSRLTEFSTGLNYMHISRSITVIDNSFAEKPAQTLD